LGRWRLLLWWLRLLLTLAPRNISARDRDN